MRDDPRWTRIQMWRPVREVLQAAGELFEEADRLRAAAEVDAGAGPPPIAMPRGNAGPPLPAVPPAYLRRRRALRELFEARLDPALTDRLGTWQKHLCVLAMASFIDEREQVALGSLAEAFRLPLLQTELFDIDDGGDRFFTQLQELLRRADIHELVFEVHLLCLRSGFVGRFRDRRHELDKLIERVVERVRAGQPPGAALATTAAPPARPHRVGFVGFPVRYYVGVGALALALFVILRVISDREVRGSNLAEYCQYDGAR